MGIMLIYFFTVSTVKKHIDFRAYRLSLESFEKAPPPRLTPPPAAILGAPPPGALEEGETLGCTVPLTGGGGQGRR